MRRNTLGIAILGMAVLGFVSDARAQNVVGQVSSASGNISAQGPKGSRGLGCGDSVFAGETLVTGSDSRVSVLMGDVLAQVGAESSLRVATTDAGGPDATLQRGRVRMIDVRDGGAPGRLAAGGAEGALVGNDAEAYIFAEKVGNYAMFCEWDAPLAVARNGQRAVADPGNCVIAKPSERLYTARAHSDRIPAAGSDYCPPNLTGLASTTPHFSTASTRDVAAGPGPPPWSKLADPTGVVEIQACDDPGAICAGSNGGVIVISEPPPSTDPQPGAGGPFPGGGTVNEPPPSTDPQPGGGGPFPGTPDA